MQTLEFLNPTFLNGINVTVRKGDKWAKIFDSGVRDVVLKETGGAEYGTAQLKSVELCKFEDIKPEWLQMEHDVACRTIFGLKDAMLRAYPNFSEADEVAVVFFNVNS